MNAMRSLNFYFISFIHVLPKESNIEEQNAADINLFILLKFNDSAVLRPSSGKLFTAEWLNFNKIRFISPAFCSSISLSF